MNVLIAFATYSGSTEIASSIIRDSLSAQKHTVIMKNPKDISEADVQNSDLTVLCSPTWDFSGKEGQPHEDFMDLIGKFKGKTFPGKKYAVMGLGDSSYQNFCGSVEILEAFIAELKGQLAVPSLKIDGFFYDQEKNSGLIKSWAASLG